MIQAFNQWCNVSRWFSMNYHLSFPVLHELYLTKENSRDSSELYLYWWTSIWIVCPTTLYSDAKLQNMRLLHSFKSSLWLSHFFLLVIVTVNINNTNKAIYFLLYMYLFIRISRFEATLDVQAAFQNSVKCLTVYSIIFDFFLQYNIPCYFLLVWRKWIQYYSSIIQVTNTIIIL